MRLHFVECGHSICQACVLYQIWEANRNILCCCDPRCPVCEEVTDIDAEAYPDKSERVCEKPLDS